MLANHENREHIFNNKKIIINRGQLISGRHSLSDRTNINESKIYRLLELFEHEQLIEQQKNNRYSIVTILNYNDYQPNEQHNEQPVNNQRTTSEQPVNTPKALRSIKNTLKNVVTDEDFFKTIQKTYTWVDINQELTKMDGWLLSRPGRKKTRRFIINWLNKVEKPYEQQNTPAPRA